MGAADELYNGINSGIVSLVEKLGQIKIMWFTLEWLKVKKSRNLENQHDGNRNLICAQAG